MQSGSDKSGLKWLDVESANGPIDTTRKKNRRPDMIGPIGDWIPGLDENYSAVIDWSAVV